MFQLHCTDEKNEESSEKKKCEGDLSENMEFWRSLIETPGCIHEGICNNCGCCEH